MRSPRPYADRAPEFGPLETARALGIDTGTWVPPTGENFDPKWFDWQPIDGE